MSEKGSNRVQALIVERENRIHISQITLPEVAAALSAKTRTPDGINETAFNVALERFLKDCDGTFRLLDVSRPVIDLAVKITQRRRIRGCDAIQLATAVTLSREFDENGLGKLLLVASDTSLLQAASEEGLAIENPEEHD